ncbi:hypothetical protein WKV44_07955 [Spirochaetia bacterium 38H-sp]|uniref:Uncharacterized protein n=1 Tax=Rarispira pelagica TaxID=3141764 RepID=A0ABU9UCS6_9SPIR
MKKAAILLLLFFCITDIFADNPWKKIETEHYEIIFRESYTRDAIIVANMLENSIKENYSISNKKPARKWQVVLTKDSMVPNGFVSIAPSVSMWFDTPVASFSGDWYAALASHETRHMAQMDSQRQGLWVLFYTLGGEYGEAAHLFTYPFWFIEGDAVWNETVLSDKGRGRDPEFSALFRALAIEQKISYNLMVNRSYKKYLPNHYVLGYHLVSYIREKYGEEKLREIINKASYFPFSSLESSIKSVTGKKIADIYNEMIKEYSALWNEQIEKQPVLSGKKLIEDMSEDFISYSQMHIIDDLIYTESFSLEKANTINVYRKDMTKKTVLRLPSYFESAISDNYIYWLEYDKTNNPNINYSNIHRLDIKTGKREKLTQKEKFFAISCNRDGNLIVAARMRDDHRAQIQLFTNKNRGFEEAPFFSYTLPSGIMPAYLALDDNGEQIAISANSIEGSSLLVISVKTAKTKIVIPPGLYTIKNPVFYNDGILFSADFKGYTAIFSVLNTDYSNDIYLVATGKYMAHHPYVRDGVLYYADFYSSHGDIIRTKNINPLEWMPISQLDDISVVCAKKPKNLESVFDSSHLKDMDIKQYSISDYNPIINSINFHSWTILPADISNPEDKYSVFRSASLILFSNDIFGRTGFMLSGAYNFSDSGIRGLWSYYFSPYLSLSGIYSYDTLSSDFSSEYSAVFSLPFNFSNNVMSFNSRYSYLIPSVSINAINNNIGLLLSIKYGLDYSFLLMGSIRDVFPILGLSVSTALITFPEKDMSYSIGKEKMDFFLPGGIPHSSLQLSFSSLQTPVFAVSSDIVYGVSAPKYSKNVATGRLYYDFPVFYPDWAASSYLSLKRIRIAGFSELGSYNESSVVPSFSFSHISAGIGLVNDFSVGIPTGGLSVTSGVYWAGRVDGQLTPGLWLDAGIVY